MVIKVRLVFTTLGRSGGSGRGHIDWTGQEGGSLPGVSGMFHILILVGVIWIYTYVKVN